MKTVGWVWLAAVCWAGCENPAAFGPVACLSSRDCETPIVCSHRGLCGDFPENTLSGFLACEQARVPMLEVDTRETIDGHIVVMHDDTVDRTTDGEQRFPGRTAVDRLTLEEFQALLIDDEACLVEPGSHPDRCHPPSLAELIERTSDETLLFIDFKAGDSQNLARAVEDISGRVILYDPSLEVLRDYRQVLPDGLVMPRATNTEEVAALLSGTGDLDLRWIHADPGFMAEAEAILEGHQVRLYVDGFGEVDPYFTAAELAQDPGSREEFERQAFEALDGMIRDGARGLGTNFAHRYVDHLYPKGLAGN